jgi:hypothetical protein
LGKSASASPSISNPSPTSVSSVIALETKVQALESQLEAKNKIVKVLASEKMDLMSKLSQSRGILH